MQFAVFLEPGIDLREAILGWKSKISSSLPGQPYCSHPPHCTLINVEIINKEKLIIDQIKSILIKITPFTIKVEKVGIFWDDPATGGHTLFLSITPNSVLNDLQILVAESLSSIVQPNRAPSFVEKENCFCCWS